MQKKSSAIAVTRGLLAGVVSAGVISLLFLAGLFETVELKALDYRFHAYAKRLTPSEDIAIVTIDQNSIDYLKYRMGIVWKWPRDVYAHVIRYLHDSGARAILLDFDFSDPDIDRAGYGEGETDRALADAIRDAGIVVTSALFSREDTSDLFPEEEARYGRLRRFALPVTGAGRLRLGESRSVVMPIGPLLAASHGMGASNIAPDRDGILRKAGLFQSFRNDLYPSSALSLVASVRSLDSLAVDDLNLHLADSRIPLTESGEIYINWYGPGGPEGGTYRYYPIADVLLSSLRRDDGLAPLIDPAEFREKIVLIGSNAPSLYDLKPTPFSDRTAYPGVEIVATVINNLLDGTPLKAAGRGTTLLLILAFSLAAALLASVVQSIPRNAFITVSLMAGFYALAVAAFYRNLLVDVVPVEAGILLSFIGITLVKYFTEGKEKRWLKKAFSQYLSPSVIEEIIDNPEKLKLGGEKRDVTILFSDIRGFTSLSEKLEPEQIAHILNEYFTPMTDIIFRHHGTLDKYVGDAIMAFFGAPLPLAEHPVHACDAALDMLGVLEGLKERWKAGGMPGYIQNLNIGIGINSGPVAVGNMGSESRFDYTVIGDHVNLSSRLEGINKAYGTNIIVSAHTHQVTRDRFIYRELDLIKVKGKSVPVTIYELIKRNDGGPGDDRLRERIARFTEALSLYRNQQWEDSLAIFRQLYTIEGDGVCEVFMERIAGLREAPLPADWDGVFERREK